MQVVPIKSLRDISWHTLAGGTTDFFSDPYVKASMAQMSQANLAEGNTKTSAKKRISPSKRWCFTLNNYVEGDLDQMVTDFETNGFEYVIGKEVGESGTPHLQGYVESSDKFRPMEKFSKWRGKPHWEKCKGDRDSNVQYCTKDGSFHTNIKMPRKLTFPPMDKPWEIDILNIIKQEPDDRTIYWYWSDAGNMGKTTFCKYLACHHDACCLCGKGADVRNGALTWKKDKGSYPELCVFPIPCSFNSDYLSYEAIENVKDAFFYSGKYEGGTVCDPCPHLFVFSNFPPETDKMKADRWVIRCIDDYPELMEKNIDETVPDNSSDMAVDGDREDDVTDWKEGVNYWEI